MSFDRLLMILLASSTFSASAAQEVDGDEIETAVEELLPEVLSFAAEVATRAEVYSAEAQALSDSVHLGDASLPKGLAIEGIEALNLSALVDQQDAGSGGQVLVFASLGMPGESLRLLIADAERARVPVLLHAFKGGSLGETAKALREVLGTRGADDVLGGVLIDPRAFSVFGVESVPSFIAVSGALPQCRGLDCSVPVPPHDRLAGNMSLRAALQILASEGEAAVQVSHDALSRLKARP